MAKSLPKASKISKKVRDELNGELDTFLSKMQVVNGFLDIDQFDALHKLAQKLLQHEPWKSHIGVFDLMSILNDHARRYELPESGDAISVAAHLGKERFERYRTEVHEYLRSLPRAFEITFDLPSMPSWGAGELTLANNIALVERRTELPVPAQKVKNAVVAALLSKPVEQHVPVVLRINAFGYGDADVNTTAVSNAISQMKQFFQMFRRIKPYKAKEGLISSRMIPEIKCRVIDPVYPDEIRYVRLPVHLSSFLASVCLDENELRTYDYSTGATILGVPARKAETREEKSSALLSSMSWITSVLNCPESWPDADRLRSALEWGFDSEENDNQTFAFIQACIGIEALLGDDDQDEPLTTRLADRCAYLLGTSHKDRADIRKRFKRMYDVRSKVIHGRRPRLSHSDAQELYSAQLMLAEVVTAEGNALLKALNKTK